jgi:Domain of unknown function (DUF4451)
MHTQMKLFAHRCSAQRDLKASDGPLGLLNVGDNSTLFPRCLPVESNPLALRAIGSSPSPNPESLDITTPGGQREQPGISPEVNNIVGHHTNPPGCLQTKPRFSECAQSDPCLFPSTCLQPELVQPGYQPRVVRSRRSSKRTTPYSLDEASRRRWAASHISLSTPGSSPFPSLNPGSSAETRNYGSTLPPSVTSNFCPPKPLQKPDASASPSFNPRPSSRMSSSVDSNKINPPSSSSPLPKTSYLKPSTITDLGNQDFSYHTELPGPPDLLGPLQEEQIAPPPQDMNPDDPDLIPRQQELRFKDDLYTPRWVRGRGCKREGWCGICRPGRWLVLKNSAFWYDRSFTHGVSAVGHAFEEPQAMRKSENNPEIWEGLCGHCKEWVALVSSKKKGTIWFRHAYKVGFLS